MKFLIYKTSNAYMPEEEPIDGCMKEYTRDGKWYYTKEVNTIEELLDLCNIAGQIVVNNYDVLYEKPKIEIYDDYRE